MNLQENKRVGLFFGSFNPIHIGHLILSEYVLNHTLLDEVWFVVSPQSPFKEEECLLPEQDRLRMVEMAIEGHHYLKACDIEFALPKPSYSIHTLESLFATYPNCAFSLIIGEDNLDRFHQWKDVEKILHMCELYVYPRSSSLGSHIPISSRIHRIDAPLLNISSTLIRHYVQQRKSVRYLLPEKVRMEIENKGFFR